MGALNGFRASNSRPEQLPARHHERLAEFDRLIQAVRAEALSAVAELHTPKDNGRVSMCCSCEQWIESSGDEACIEYPCPTVEAITEALGEV